LTSHQKLYIGFKDSTDYPIYFVSAAFAAIGQVDNNNPSFGQGIEGYAKRYAASFADQGIGNMMVESFFPMMLHEDPRYFILGSGTTRHRLFYALTRILITKTDSNGLRINTSELGGNAVSTAISNFYYKDNRTAVDNVQKWGTQVGTDALSNVLKEFWPDVKRRLLARHTSDTTP
jgi:hypothetical protein